MRALLVISSLLMACRAAAPAAALSDPEPVSAAEPEPDVAPIQIEPGFAVFAAATPIYAHPGSGPTARVAERSEDLATQAWVGRVVKHEREWLEIQTGDGPRMHCYSEAAVLRGFSVTLYVRASAALPVLTRELRPNIEGARRVRVGAGTLVTLAPKGAGLQVHGLPNAGIEIPADAVARSYPAPRQGSRGLAGTVAFDDELPQAVRRSKSDPRFGTALEEFKDGRRRVLVTEQCIEFTAIATARSAGGGSGVAGVGVLGILNQGSIMAQGAGHVVARGATVYWEDGTPAGKSHRERRFTTRPRARKAAGRTCFTVPLVEGVFSPNDDPKGSMVLCFDDKDVEPYTSPGIGPLQ